MLIMASLPLTLILYLSRARLTVVEPALFEGDVFEMVALIQSPAKCEVVPSYDFSMQKVNIQQKFTNKLLLFMVTQ